MYPINLNNFPDGFKLIDDKVEFNPKKHLQLEKPREIYTLKDLGYDKKVIDSSPSNLAATSVFRILSDEGCEVLLDVTKKLEKFTTSSPRIPRNVRGGVYRSKFLRDLCVCDEISIFLSNIAGINLSPHTIPHQLGHLNYNPLEIGANVDKWHVDTLMFDYVMFVTDPKKIKGGQFQYFFGTQDEMAEIKKNNRQIPNNKIISPEIPGPGFAIFQQGKHVVHRATSLGSPGERITMVNGYMTSDPSIKDYTKYGQLCHVDPIEIISKEFTNHTATHVKKLLEEKILNKNFQDLNLDSIKQLENASEILKSAIDQLKKGKAEMEHFGD
jgi:hypothetical protein